MLLGRVGSRDRGSFLFLFLSILCLIVSDIENDTFIITGTPHCISNTNKPNGLTLISR